MNAKYTIVAIVLVLANIVNFFDLDDTDADKAAREKTHQQMQYELNIEDGSP